MNMKRMRSSEEEVICGNNNVGIEEMAKCLMLLSQHYQHEANNNIPIKAKPIRMYRPAAQAEEYLASERFECKTCNRRFTSFQALGGHRASHKKPCIDHRNNDVKSTIALLAGGAKKKKHECSICGVVFSMGQALGGHMRRHRAAMEANAASTPLPPLMVLNRSNSHLKVSSINTTTFLDLNLTPLENDLKLLFGIKY